MPRKKATIDYEEGSGNIFAHPKQELLKARWPRSTPGARARDSRAAPRARSVHATADSRSGAA